MSALRSTHAIPLGPPVRVDVPWWPRRLRAAVARRVQALAVARRRTATATARAPAARTTTLRAAGDMTDWGAVQSLASRAAARIQGAAARQGDGAGAARGASLVVDLESVTRADTKLIACLVCLTSAARHAGCALEFRFSPAVRDWVSLCGLEAVLSGGRAPTAPAADPPRTE